VDIAAGGSGSHSGTYYDQQLVPPGIDGYHLFIDTSDGTVRDVQNNSDLIILGDLTLGCWLHEYEENEQGYIGSEGWLTSCRLIACGADGETLATNYCYLMQVSGTATELQLFWEYGAGSNVAALSGAGLVNNMGWTHVMMVREDYSGGPNQQVKFYKDGQLFSTDNNSGAGFTPPADGSSGYCQIGRGGESAGTARAHIGSVRIYNEALDAAAVETVYDSEKEYFQNVQVVLNEPGFVKIDKVLDYKAIYAGSRSGRTGAGFSR
jgi:hypothetical protein